MNSEANVDTHTTPQISSFLCTATTSRPLPPHHTLLFVTTPSQTLNYTNHRRDNSYVILYGCWKELFNMKSSFMNLCLRFIHLIPLLSIICIKNIDLENNIVAMNSTLQNPGEHILPTPLCSSLQ